MISDAELSSEKKEDILAWEKKIGFIFRSLLQEMPKMLFLSQCGKVKIFLTLGFNVKLPNLG